MVPPRLTRRDALRLSGVSLLGIAGCASRDSGDWTTFTREPPQTPAEAGAVEALPTDHPALAWAVRLPKPVRRTPTVDPEGDRLYVGCLDEQARTPAEDGDGAPFGALFSLGTTDGGRRWGIATVPPVAGRPVVNDGIVHVVTGYFSGFGGTRQRIVGFSRTGERRWQTRSPYGTLEIVAAKGDTVFAGTRDDALDTERQRLWAVRGDGEIRWDREAGDALGATIVGDSLLYGAGDAALVSYDVETGDERWRIDEDPIGDQRRWLVAFDGRCFTETGGEGTTLVARSAVDGAQQWQYAPVSTPGLRFVPTAVTNAEPAVDDPDGGISTVGADYGGLVFALDDEGDERWTFETEGDTSDHLAVGDAVYVGDREGTVYALDPADGRERWRASLPEFPSVLPLGEGVLAASGDRERSVLASFRPDGGERWRYSTTKDLTWPTVDGDRTYVAARDGTVLAFDQMA